MIFKVIYTLIILIICIVVYNIFKKNEHSLGYIVVTGIFTTIIGNLLIPSDISIFDIFNHFMTTQKDIESSSNDIEDVIPKIELELESLDLLVSDEYILKITELPDDVYINWESNNPEIVTVDSNGNIKAINEGNTIITASIIYKDIKYVDTCNVIVNNPVINLNPSYSIYTGETYNLSATTIPANVNIIWNSNNTDIATVNNIGEIEGIAEGTAIITATMVYNNISYSADCIVTVKIPIDETYNALNDDIITNEIESDEQIINDSKELETSSLSLTDDSVVWLQQENVYKETSQKTVREEWSDCIRFGSSNLNADGDACIIVACDQKYNKFTAEIAPQEGFDKTDKVTLYVYGVHDGTNIFNEPYLIDFMTKNTEIELDITGVDELYFFKNGDYNQAKIAGQYINGYTGMGVLMRNATLYK